MYMPAEWQPQAATWLSWPHNEETWPENLAEAQAEFVAFANAIAAVQPVKVMCAGPASKQAQSALTGIARLELVPIPTNDAWARDYAPTFVVNSHKKLVAVNWRYNAWGGKYPPFDLDEQVATRVGDHLGVPVVSPDLCFEGGGIEVNDSRVMLCTKTCALDPNRNPGKTLSEIEGIFVSNLGVQNIIWLPGDAIDGDDTDGHIDQLARFTDDRTLVYAWSDDSEDPQQAGLAENLEALLTGLNSIRGSSYRVIPLPIPPAMELHGRRIPASYCNFLICNGLVIVPQFGNSHYDRLAMHTLKPLFPNHRLVALDSLNLTVGLGSFHCLSQQQPAISHQ
jgi:agmatine deiminase